MGKKILSLCMALVLCLGLLPVTALAAGEIKLFIGGQQITENGCYENRNGTWTKVDGTEPANGQFYYDAATFTLTLNQAEITHNQTVNVAEGYTYEGSVIAFSQTADVSLNIVVSQGTSTITGNGGIRVESTTENASLSIKGPGSLDVKPIGSNSGITLSSSKNTNLDIDGADVTASSRAQHGVYLLSDTATSTSTITVNNGSLTTGGNGNVGIYYYWSGTSNAGTSSLTVSGNAVVDTRNSKILTNNEETVVQVGAGSDGNGGIVFNGKSGTVYGNVTLQEDITISEGESLDIPSGASLTIPEGTTLTVNGGELTGENIPTEGVVYADEDAPDTLLVGGTNVKGGGYWTTTSGTLASSDVNTWNVHYDEGTNTLYLNGATITASSDSNNNTSNAGIYATASEGQSVSLNIVLQGDNNQVSGVSGIYVFSDSGDASLSISGTGSLTAEGTGYGNYSGIMVQSNGGKAELTINNVDVTATNSNTQGIRLQPAGTSPATLAVNGGSLTASGSKGIDYQFGTGTTGSGTPTVTVSNNAIVRANGSISNNSSTAIQIGADSNESNGGIVFDGNKGTVYGSVELQENLTIGEGESLTIPDGASLTIPDGKTLTVNGGELTGDVTGTVIYKFTGVSLNKDSLTLDVGARDTLTATITPDNATNKNVTWSSDTPSVASVNNGVVTAVAPGTATITVTTEDGNKTATCAVTVEKPYTPPPYIPPTKTPSQQAVDKIEDAKEGSTVKITLRTGQTKLDKEVFEELAGRDVTLEISLPGGVTWTVNGEDIPKTADLTDLDLGVSLNTSTIPVDLINAITGEIGTVQLTLKHDGPFGFTMTLTAPVGKGNKGLWANLYHYDEDAGEMVYQSAALVDEDGNAALPFDHASQYAIVLDSKSHELPFTDLGESQWYESAVAYAYRHGIMEGMSDTTFQPNGTLSRAMAVQIFYNLEGQPDISDENLGYPYEDVDAQAWYGDAVYWARITGVATGYGDGTFQPGDSITRQEFAQMLYNYAKYKGYDLTAEGDLSTFPDAGSIADWAKVAMSWANGNELINGHDDGTIDAGGAGTRAQAASILMRFDQNLVKN